MSPSRQATEPILFLDVDGVISLFGFSQHEQPPGRFHLIDGAAHFIGAELGGRIERLRERFELVWATGWEERANEHLPELLGLPGLALPTLSFDGRARFGTAHWKVDAIHEHAGDRPAAWVDDNLDEACRTWAAERSAPTLLVPTDPATGLSERHVEDLIDWAERVTEGRLVAERGVRSGPRREE